MEEHVEAQADVKVPEQIVNVDQCIRAFELYTGNSTVAVCMEELHTLLFGHGLDLIVGTQANMPTDHQAVLKNEMLSFLKDVFMSIMVFGVVPIEFVDGPSVGGTKVGFGEKRRLPHVPTFGTFYLKTCSTPRRKQIFTVYAGEGVNLYKGALGGKAQTQFQIIDKFGYTPRLDGTLCSPMQRVASRLVFATQMYSNAVISHRANALAPILLRRDPTTEPTLDPGLRTRYFASDPTVPARSQQAQRPRDPEQLREFVRQMRAWSERTNTSTEVLFGVRSDGVEDVHHTDVQNTFFDSVGVLMPYAEVPAGFAVAPYPRSSAPPDIVRHEQHIMDIVISILLTPKLLYASTSQTARSDSTKVETSMFRTARKWATTLETTLNSVVDKMHTTFAIQGLVQSESKLRYGARPPTKEDIANLEQVAERAKDIQLTFSLSVPLHTTAEDLHHMYQNGIITWTEYATRVRDIHHIQGDIPRDPTRPEADEESTDEEDQRPRKRRGRTKKRKHR